MVSIAVLVSAIIGLGMIAIRLGPDASYDFYNYHFYNGYALFNKPLGFDIAPAQVQTFLHPGVDGLFYLLWRQLGNYPRAITFVWAMPQGVAVWFSFLIARRLLSETGSARDALAAVAAALGAGGATSVGVIGTTMSEGILNVFIAGAVLTTLRGIRGRVVWIRLLLGGVLAGAAVGLKLTAATYGVAFVVALLLTSGMGDFRTRARALLAFAVGALPALIAVGGPWWWWLHAEFGSPLFPFYNAIFRSPDYGFWNYVDDTYLKSSMAASFSKAILFALWPVTIASEVPVRDPRILLGLLSALGILAYRGLRPRTPPSNLLVWYSIWFLSTYLVWLRVFSIQRYISGLETLSGVGIIAFLNLSMRCITAVYARVAVVCCGLVAVTMWTVYPDWGRRQFTSTSYIDAEMSPLSPNSLVVMLVQTPSAYLAAFAPPSARFIGTCNNLIYLRSKFGLQRRIEDAIRSARGDIWGLDKTDAFEGLAELTLERYGLRRTGTCHMIQSNGLANQRLCQLERTRDPAMDPAKTSEFKCPPVVPDWDLK